MDILSNICVLVLEISLGLIKELNIPHARKFADEHKLIFVHHEWCVH